MIIVTVHPQGTVSPFTLAGVEPTQRGGRPVSPQGAPADPDPCPDMLVGAERATVAGEASPMSAKIRQFVDEQ